MLELEELLAGLEIVQLTDALDDPRLAAAIRRMGLDVVRGAIDRLEAQSRFGERPLPATPTAPGAPRDDLVERATGDADG